MENMFFDYEGVLVNNTQNKETLMRAHDMLRKSLLEQGIMVGLNKIYESSDKTKDEYLEYRKEFPNNEWPMSKFISGIFNKLEIPINPEKEKEYIDIYTHNNHDYELREDVLDTIPQLSKRFDLGIITNSTHNSLIRELNEFDLLRFFPTIVISSEVGKRKPDSLIYEVAIKKSGKDAKECYFVGHESWEVEGAEKVGMRGVFAGRGTGKSIKTLLELI